MDIEAEAVGEYEHDRWKEQHHKHKHHHHYYRREGGKGSEYMDGNYVHSNTMGGGYGWGGGGGWGIPPVGLFGVTNNGLFGNRDHDGRGNCCDKGGHHDYEVLEALGDIKQEVAEVSATATQALTGLINNGQLAACAANGQTNHNIASGFAGTNAHITEGNSQILAAIKDSQYAVTGVINANALAAEREKNIELNARLVAIEAEGRRRSDHDAIVMKVENNNSNIAQANAVAVARNDEARWARLEGAFLNLHQTAASIQKTVNFASPGAVTGQTANPTNNIA